MDEWMIFLVAIFVAALLYFMSINTPTTTIKICLKLLIFKLENICIVQRT